MSKSEANGSSAPNHTAEQQLWTRFLAGEESAFQLLMTTYYGSLFRYGTRFSKDREFIKDCIQDLFLYLWERRASLRTEIVLKPYLMASLRRYMHRHIPDANLSEEFSDDKVQRFDFEFSVEETFIRQETTFNRSQHMQSLLQTLPRRQKEVIYLKFFQELEREQIAEVMDIAPQTVSNLLQLALRHLRQYWKLELLTLLVANLCFL